MRARAFGCTLLLWTLLRMESVAHAAGGAAPGAVAVPIAIRTGNEKPAVAYVALVAPDRPMHRPSAEALAPYGSAILRLPPGTYRAIAGAPGYQDRTVSVRVPSGELRFDLEAEVPVEGTVVDEVGHPVAGAHVMQARLAGPLPAGQFSEMARRLLAPAWSTRTDGRGRWTLPGHSDGTLPLVVEADGYASALVRDPAVPCVLRRGGSLRATLDRVDADLVVTLVPAEPRDAALPAEWHARVYARHADQASLQWGSLAPGRYQVIARYLDPRHFQDPQPLASVTIAASATQDVNLTLPRHVEAERNAAVLFLARKTSADLVAARATAITSAGEAEDVRIATEPSSDGVLVYLRTNAAPEQLLVAAPAFLAAGNARIAPPVSMDNPAGTVISPRGDLSFRFVTGRRADPPVAGPPLPAWTLAELGDCSPAGDRFALAVPVARDGAVALPFASACHSLTLRQPPFEPVSLEATAGAGETRSLGELELHAGAAVNVHVLRDPGNLPAAGARVRVLYEPSRDRRRRIAAEGTTDADGRLTLRGLPAARELVVEATDAATGLSGSHKVEIGAGTTATVDPLSIPLPAKAVFLLRLAPAFQQRFPDARILSVTIDREADGPEERRTKEAGAQDQAIPFEDIPPGDWQPLVLIEAGSSVQPVPLDALALRAGEERRVEDEIEPVVIEGRVTEGGTGVAAQVGIADRPSPNALTRFARSGPDGRFTIVLPAAGVYSARVTRLDHRDERIDLGEVDLRDPRRVLELAIPGSALLVRVKDGDQPAAGVRVEARLLRSSLGGGVARILRSATANTAGEARFESLPSGRWSIEARDARTHRAVQTATDVATVDSRIVDVALGNSSSYAGYVRDPDEVPVPGAAVDCLYTGTGGLPRSTHAESDATGHFAIELPAPLPPLLRCGVATPGGAIAAYTATPSGSADFLLPREAASLLIPDWGRQLRVDTVWLAAPDGRLFSLSWAAAKFGRLWSPLTIPRLPAGSWKIVTIDTLGDWLQLANGGEPGLPAVADLNLKAGESKTVRLEKTQP